MNAQHTPSSASASPLPPKEALKELEAAESALKEGRTDLVRRPIRVVIIACFVLGAICIVSTILRTWFGSPAILDFAILFVGVVLCAISLLKKFKVGPKGISGEVVDLFRVLEQLHQSISRLL